MLLTFQLFVALLLVLFSFYTNGGGGRRRRLLRRPLRWRRPFSLSIYVQPILLFSLTLSLYLSLSSLPPPLLFLDNKSGRLIRELAHPHPPLGCLNLLVCTETPTPPLTLSLSLVRHGHTWPEKSESSWYRQQLREVARR